MIYCVKLRQKQLSNISSGILYFPYDRFYLIPKKQKDLMYKMFQYFFYLPASSATVTAISGYTYKQLRIIPAIERPKTISDKETLIRNTTQIWDNLINNEFMIIIPTYPKRINKTSQTAPAYYMTEALLPGSNHKINLPQVGIHTPTRDIPLICAVCKNYIGYCENECAPGGGTCKKSIEITIKHNT